MATVERLMPSALRRRRRWLLWALLTLLLIFGPILFAWGYFEWRVAHRIAKIRAKGEPTTWQEAKALIDDSTRADNCAGIWKNAWENRAAIISEIDEQQLPFVGKAKPIPLGESWPDIETAEIYLKDQTETLSLIQRAADLGGQANFDLDWSLGFGLFIDHLPELQTLFDLEALATHVAIHRYDATAAAKHLNHRVALVHSIGADATLVVALMQRSWLSKLLPQVGQFCSISALDDQSLKTVLASLQSLSLVPVVQALMTERAVMASLPDTAIFPNSDILVRLVSRRAFVSDYLDEMTDAIAIVKSTEDDWQQRIARASHWDSRDAKPGWNAERIFSSLYLPRLRPIAESMANGEATVRIARTAMAVRRYYDQHGSPPKTLDALTPDFLPEPLLDPFDNQPLAYVVSDKRVLIYSKGPNTTDENGQEENGDDIAIEFRLPDR